jgi:lipid-binding SYLF domain-containing protein
MFKRHIGSLVVLLTLVLGWGVSARAADPVREARDTIAAFRVTDPGLAHFFDTAAGYAVFPTVAKGAVGIGGAHGTGVLFVHGKAVGKASLNQLTVGAQLGGQEYAEIVFFETPKALSDFMKGHFALSAQASAVALKSGASANARYEEGVATFTATKGGLMYEASIGGQKFGFEPFPAP